MFDNNIFWVYYIYILEIGNNIGGYENDEIQRIDKITKRRGRFRGKPARMGLFL